MNQPDANDSLDALLFENASHMEDNGFTARVISTLPKRGRKDWLRPAILISATTLGFALLLFLPLEPILNSALTAFTSFTEQSLLMLLAISLVLASLFWSVFAMIEWED
ncbi:MAG: DUF5056 domain-containing protein [Verrucomicrobiota bacterium]|nr:DUF5056 domain-containing protein [Verrucomicrobiota bacterium]